METQTTNIINPPEENPLHKTSKFAGLIVPILILSGMIGSMIVFGVLNWNKLNTTADSHKTLEERVTRQYSIQKAAEDKMRAELDQVKAWMEWRKGYDQAVKDLK